VRLAYLLSHYPRASQVFLQREVLGLRARGVEVLTVSVRRPVDLLSDVDRAEAATTLWLAPLPVVPALRAHARALARHPGAYAAGLRRAFADAPPGRRAIQGVYWLRAILLWDLLRRRRVEHVHAHFATNASDIALLVARFGRAAGEGPRSFSLHLHGPTDFFEIAANRVALKAREASGVLCISDYARAQTLAWVEPERWDRVHVARYGVPVPPARAVVARADGPLRILTVGRLAGVKGQVVLLEAFAALGGDAELDVVGDGPLRDELPRRAVALGIADRVRFHGALGHDRVAALYARADVFCLPSFAEGLPVVVLEAMAAGLPVVTTAITGVPEAIADGEDGLLVRPGRADELRAALARLLGDPSLRARLGAAARVRIERELTVEASTAQILAALRAVVPEERPAR